MLVCYSRSSHLKFKFRFELVEVPFEGFIFHSHVHQGVSGFEGLIKGEFLYEVSLDFGKCLIFVFDSFIGTSHEPSFSEGSASSHTHFVEKCQDFVLLLVKERVHSEVCFYHE